MSSALCGPSSPLASLEKHSSRDRSLQHDRYNTPTSSSLGGFRNQPGPADGLAEAEFAEFAQARQLPHGLSLEAVGHDPSQLNSWAIDFESLHLQPQPSTQPLLFGRAAALPRQAQHDWQDEFMRTETSIPTQPWLPAPAMAMFGQYSSPQFQQQPGVLRQTEGRAVENFDEDALEKAFADAAREVDDRRAWDNPEQRDRALQESTEETGGEQAGGQDDLARTAAQLLESLKGNISQKFQESKFLTLMRQLRDREVAVEGDKMVQLEK